MFPPPATQLTHILVVADPARSRDWYETVLGASVERAYGSSVGLPLAGAWLAPLRGGGPLLVEAGGPTPDKPTVTLEPPTQPDRRDNLFTIRVDDCQATYDLLR